MSAPPFVHLHCHSHYSLLDGAGSIGALVAKAKSAGMNALALTDHGNLYGALEFYRKAKDAEINPILGMEAYIAPGSRFKREAGADEESSYHLTLLAQNRQGFQNLIKLSSKAFLEGFYYKPRIDREILEAHSEGLVCLSGCVSGEFSLRAAQRRQSRRRAPRSRGHRRLVSQGVRRPLLHRVSRTMVWRFSGWRCKAPSKWPTGWACRWWPPATRITSTRTTRKPRTFCCVSTRVVFAPTPTA